jgi:mannosyltransferase OCH1-like enzyme
MGEIPKIIHYCWFGKGELPKLIEQCIKTWKRLLPDYRFMLWNEDTFDFNDSAWCQKAYSAKRYAFVADYVRLVVLYQWGGIYLDTDIKVRKSFNNLLNQDAFMGFEDGRMLSAGVIGVHPQNSFIKECLDYYKEDFDLEFLLTNLYANATNMTERLCTYGLKTDNQEQYVNGIHVYPKTYFNPMDYFGNWDKSVNTYCIHLYMGSWLPEDQQKKLKLRKTLLFRVCKRIYVMFGRFRVIKNFRFALKNHDIV